MKISSTKVVLCKQLGACKTAFHRFAMLSLPLFN